MIGIFEGIEVGAWYRSPGTEPFEVVALDFDSETVEIQYYDGSVAELDYESWLDLGAQPTTGPDSFDGALDLSHEDMLAAESAARYDEWDHARQILGQ